MGLSRGCANRLPDMPKAEPVAQHHLNLSPHQAQLHLLQRPSVQQTSAALLTANALLLIQGGHPSLSAPAKPATGLQGCGKKTLLNTQRAVAI